MPLSQVLQVEENIRLIARRAPELPLIESIIFRVAMILGRDVNALFDHMLKPAGLAEPELRLLLALYARGGSAFPGELSAALAQSPANLTRIGDGLVRQGYVARTLDATDRRKMLLTLKPAGQRLASRTIPQFSASVAAIFADFTAAEKKRLLADLKKLLRGTDALSATEQGSPRAHKARNKASA
jgi:MarR family transcriptional repressor of emrRAB